MIPAKVLPGLAVWLDSIHGGRWPATVDTDPWEIQPGRWVVGLKGLPKAYGELSGHKGSRAPCVPLERLSVRVE